MASSGISSPIARHTVGIKFATGQARSLQLAVRCVFGPNGFACLEPPSASSVAEASSSALPVGYQVALLPGVSERTGFGINQSVLRVAPKPARLPASALWAALAALQAGGKTSWAGLGGNRAAAIRAGARSAPSRWLFAALQCFGNGLHSGIAATELPWWVQVGPRHLRPMTHRLEGSG